VCFPFLFLVSVHPKAPPLGRRQGKGVGFVGCYAANQSFPFLVNHKRRPEAFTTANLFSPSYQRVSPSTILRAKLDKSGVFAKDSRTNFKLSKKASERASSASVANIVPRFFTCFPFLFWLPLRCALAMWRQWVLLASFQDFLHKRKKIVRKSLRLQRFARYLFHRICGL
jgi:hypothetical protein